MKIALCFSGEPRFVEECFSGIKKNLLETNHNIDIFIHTWFSEKISEKVLYSKYVSSFSGDSKINKEIIPRIIHLYNPVKISVEEPKKFIHTDLDWGDSIDRYYGKGDPNLSKEEFSKIKINNMYSFFYSNMKSILLKKEYELENNFVYDCVVRFRFDNIVSKPIIFSEYDLEYLHYQDMSQPDRMVSDWINFSNSRNMDSFSSIFQNFENLSRIALRNYNAYSPESIIRVICDLLRIECQGHYFNIELPKHGKIN